MGRLELTRGKEKTMADCAHEINAMLSKYECLTNLFLESGKERLIRSLFTGYEVRNSKKTRQPRPGLIGYFTPEDLKDSENIHFANCAIAEHNNKVEEKDKLAFQEMFYFDTCNDRHGRDYFLYFVARKLSNGKLKPYRAVIRTPYPDGKEVVEGFCFLTRKGKKRKAKKGKVEKRKAKKKRKRSDESIPRVNSDSIGIPDS
ncbi:hypothetical protein OROHE_013326 [Orobanche hederae]